jgi:NADH-quinone oxidoreductase subunit H
LWFFIPFFSLWFSFIGWYAINSNHFFIWTSLNYGLLFILVISSFNIYWVFLAGWFGRSQYGVLGALRSISQLISYELVLGMCFVPVGLATGSLNLNVITFIQATSCWLIFPLLPSSVVYFICLLAETNRIPFDLLEAEAELVAGYYTEYGGFWFASFFLSEYGSMLLLSSLFCSLFLGGGCLFTSHYTVGLWSDVVFYTKVLIVIFCIIFIRANLPRFRFDQLMYIGWKALIPLSVGLILFYAGIFICLACAPLSQIPLASEPYMFVVCTGVY